MRVETRENLLYKKRVIIVGWLLIRHVKNNLPILLDCRNTSYEDIVHGFVEI
jgi:hypothetical protein